MKLGARIIKTGVAIALALYLSTLLGLNASIFAAIAAIVAIQPSIYRSYQSILEQIQANIIGALVAIALVFMLGNDPITVALAAVIVISINLKLNLDSAIPISLVTIIAIMESQGDNFIMYATMRFAAIMLGILSAFFINLIFLPPKHETKLYQSIFENTREIMQWLRVVSRNTSAHAVKRKKLNEIKNELIKINNLYLLYKEERNYFRAKDYSKKRKLVVFRQMILTTSAAFEVLKKLSRVENEFFNLPKDFHKQILTLLEEALTYHEHVMFKYAGTVRLDAPFELEQELLDQIQAVKDEFVSIYGEGHLVDNLFLFISVLIDYCEQIEHLDKLVGSYYTHHKTGNGAI